MCTVILLLQTVPYKQQCELILQHKIQPTLVY